jgi:hypothetical protein
MAFKTGFAGNSSNLYYGQVPLNQYKNHISDQRWGDRVKVRLLGYHPKDEKILADKDLPWAIVGRPTSHGSLNKTSIGISGGEWVLCSFSPFDDDDELIIISVLGRTNPTYDKETTKPGAAASFRTTLNYNDVIKPASFNLRSGPGPSQLNNVNDNAPALNEIFNPLPA